MNLDRSVKCNTEPTSPIQLRDFCSYKNVPVRIFLKRINEFEVPVYFLGSNNQFYPANVYLPETLDTGSSVVKIPLWRKKYSIEDLWADEVHLLSLLRKSGSKPRKKRLVRKKRSSAVTDRDTVIREVATKIYGSLSSSSRQLTADGKPIKTHFAKLICKDKSKYQELKSLTLTSRIVEKALILWNPS